MPVGKGAVTKLIARPEQREMIYHKIREYRHTKLLFTVDFWNDGKYVGGCIAGGRQIMDGCGRSSSSGICSIWYFKVFGKSKRRKLTILKQMLYRENKTARNLVICSKIKALGYF